MASEKEYNGNLYDQLELLDRFTKVIDDTGDIKKVREAIEYERAFIEKKLYENPPLER